jgi:lipid II:glycine glycyltransferase (peptidoglycan interpeptide bridge formation enzyme)
MVRALLALSGDMDARPILESQPPLPISVALAPSGPLAARVRTTAVASGPAWNDLVLKLGDPDLRQGFEWGELRRHVEGRTLRYAVYDGPTPVAAIAATAWRSFGSPFSLLYASRGPVLGPESEDAWPGLLDAAQEMARRTRAVFLRCSPGVPADDQRLHAALVRRGFVRLPEDWTLWNAPRVVMDLDLRPDETALKRAMRESTRLSLTRVQKHGGRVELDVSEAGVARLHRLLVAAGRRKGYPVRDLGFFQTLRRQYLVGGDGCLALACHGDRDLAGVLAVRFGRRAYLLYAAIDSSEQARKLRAGTAAHWALIRWARDAGCEALDWGSTGTGFPPCQGSLGYGIYEFKRGFGCTVIRLPGYYDLVFRPHLYRMFRWIETRCAPALWRLRARLNT